MDTIRPAGHPLGFASFAGAIGRRFRIGVEGLGRPVEVKLVEAERLPAGDDATTRESFSLIFRGPRLPLLPQGLYGFDDELLGRPEIFIVPIGRDNRGVRYQAVFG